jgi:endonuclease/exonuclease/phosphatase family metal-dependent hydrolase
MIRLHKLIFLPILVCVFGLTGKSYASTCNPEKKVELKVMTYNVHHCNPPSIGADIDIQAIAKVINAEKPDLVALQEIDVNTIRSGKGNNQAKLLGELTGMKYYFSKAIDHQGGEYGVAVLSRLPILDSIKLHLPIHSDKPEELRAVAAVKVLLPSGQPLLFASTHLGLKEANRLLQAEKIIEYFGKNDMPMILGGDFNATPDSKVIQYFDQYFSRTCLRDCGFTSPVEKPSKTIDFIMYRGKDRFKVLETRVIDEKYASDHLPVISRLRFK